MTTAGSFRTAGTRLAGDVNVAGVPWPAYKVIALAVGLLVSLIVAVATFSAAPAVLAGAAVGAVAWLGLGSYCATRR